MTTSSIVLAGVPFDGMGRPEGQSAAPAALRAAGLGRQLPERARMLPDPVLPVGSSRRGPSGLLNETALCAMVEHVSAVVAEAVGSGARPLLYGGDCSVLLAALPAATRATGGVGLVFVDGHEDGTLSARSPDGEAANMEMAILLGRDPGAALPAAIEPARGLLDGDRVAMVGMRDGPWRDRVGAASLAEAVAMYATDAEVVADPYLVAGKAHGAMAGRPWWLHVDLDVLARQEFPHYGAPGEVELPDGLAWADLTDLVTALVDSSGCAGASVVIYNPDSDPERTGAARVAAFLAALVARWS